MSSVFLKNETTIRKFDIQELLFITCDDHCLSFHSVNNVFHTTGCICDVLKALPSYFVLINRNTVINLKHIKEINLPLRRLILQNDTTHTISSRKMSSLLKMFCFPKSKLIIHTFNDDNFTFTKCN